jgi:hypothetical protein
LHFALLEIVYPEDVASVALWTANTLAKSGEAAKVKSREAVIATSDKTAVTYSDEQLSTAEMELRIKLLRENR